MADEDGWNGPRRNDEAGWGFLKNKIKKMEQQIAELQRGAPLRAAGIGMSPEGMTIGSSLNVTGDLSVSGDTAITGTLSLPAGIINNDALANPVEFRRNGGGEAGFVIPDGRGLVAVLTLTVPEGYSRAIVMAVGSASAQCTAAAAGFFYVGAQIGSALANVTYSLGEPGKYANASGSATRLLTDLVGGTTISVATTVEATNGPWTGPSSANTDAIAIFLR